MLSQAGPLMNGREAGHPNAKADRVAMIAIRTLRIAGLAVAPGTVFKASERTALELQRRRRARPALAACPQRTNFDRE